MKELLLSFDNEEIFKQKEYLFQYDHYNQLKEYFLTYQRDSVILNVECLKDLEALSKKATRSFSLCNEMITSIEPLTLQNDLIRIKMRKPFILFPKNNIIHKYKVLTDLKLLFKYTFVPVLNISAIHMQRYKNIININHTYRYKPNLESFEELHVQNITNSHLTQYESLNVSIMHDSDMMLLNNLYVNKFNHLNIFNIYNIDIIYDNVLSRFHNEICNKYFSLNIYKQRILRNKYGNTLVRLPMFMLWHHDTIKTISKNNFFESIFKDTNRTIINPQQNCFRSDFYNINSIEQINMYRKDAYTNIMQWNGLLSQDKSLMHIENILLKPGIKNIIHIENFLLSIANKIGNIYEVFNTEKLFNDHSSLNMYDDLFLKPDNITGNYLENTLCHNNINTTLNIIDSVSLEPYNKTLNQLDNMFMLPRNKTLNYFEVLNANKDINNTLKLFDYNFAINHFYYLNQYEDNLVSKNCLILNITNEIYNLNKDENKSLYIKYNGLFAMMNYKRTKLYSSEFVNQYIKYLFLNSTDFVDKDIERTLKLFDTINMSLSYKILNLLETYSFVNDNITSMYLYNTDINILKEYNYTSILNQYFADKYSNRPLKIYAIDMLKKHHSILHFYNNLDPFEINNKNLVLYHGMYGSLLNKKILSLLREFDPFIKQSLYLYFNKNEIFIKHTDKILNHLNHIYASYKHIYDADKFQNLLSINKDDKIMQRYLDALFINKDSHKFQYFNGLYKGLKEYGTINIDNYFYEMAKSFVSSIVYNNTNDTIIHINKIDKSVFTNTLLHFLEKRCKDMKYVCTSESTLSKIPSDMFFSNNLVCDQIAKNADFISIINEGVIKTRLKIWFIDSNESIHKINGGVFFTSNVVIDRIVKNIFTQKESKINKIIQGVSINNIETIYMPSRKTQLANQISFIIKFIDVNTLTSIEWANTYRLAFFHQDETVLQTLRSAMKHKEEEFASITKHINDLKTKEFATLERNVSVFHTVNEALRNDRPIDLYDRIIFGHKDLAFHRLPEIEELYKIAKEVNLSTDPITDWAWVYQDEEPFDDPFKIDELLLPENDTVYEHFEDIIFNRETLKPRSPVRIIDEYTFIAKFPNHYPIKDENGENAYKNVALAYLEVRTSIMRQVFLGYYKLWQDNIFDFAKMTIPQAAKKILDYLYTWILMYFAQDDIPEALRTFRLIRWYLERSIIECSEYQIEYTPNDATSGSMNTTKLNIPNDMDMGYIEKYSDYTDLTEPNNSMYIDTNLHVIRNDPDKLRHEAHVTFFIENHKNTLISFYLNTFTPVYIILNGEIIDTISLPTTSKMVYNIPYTEDVNVFTIQKQSIDNVDNYFYIGNIIIKDMGKDGDLNITFNPKVQGNKVLSHVSQKVFQYMNLYDDNEKLMHDLIEGNVHLSDVYDHLLEYWDLHHQDKDKGKRWTIKRT